VLGHALLIRRGESNVLLSAHEKAPPEHDLFPVALQKVRERRGVVSMSAAASLVAAALFQRDYRMAAASLHSKVAGESPPQKHSESPAT
jgi:hypothetical protein